MPYNQNIPLATDIISSSQNDLLQNFQSIHTLIGVDHVNFDDASGNQGKHNTVSMPNYVGGASSPTASANTVKLFAKNDGSNTELFILPRSGGGAERNITGRTGTLLGECTLPSGIKLKWGASSTAGTGLENIVFASGGGLTAFSTLFQVYATIKDGAGNPADTSEDTAIRIYSYSSTNFDVVTYKTSNSARVSASFSWFAIGI